VAADGVMVAEIRRVSSPGPNNLSSSVHPVSNSAIASLQLKAHRIFSLIFVQFNLL
jgi:hypothetical protein